MSNRPRSAEDSVPMIFVVYDDSLTIEAVEAVLEADGYELRVFDDPARALELAAGYRPSLIVTDVTFRTMNGVAFRNEYRNRYPHRRTSFLFISSLSKLRGIVKDLDKDLDGFIAKPFAEHVLRSKIRTMLKLPYHDFPPSYRGDFAAVPFDRLLDFAEKTGLDAEVEVEEDRILPLIVHFVGGKIPEGSLGADDLAALSARREGDFAVYSAPRDFHALAAEEGQGASAAAGPADIHTEVETEGVKFVIRTECRPQLKEIVTFVFLDGGIVSRLSRPVPASAKDADAVLAVMRKQHRMAEQELGLKVDVIAERRHKEALASKKAASAKKPLSIDFSEEQEELEAESRKKRG
jgi:CheY-like chemotaxis protein